MTDERRLRPRIWDTDWLVLRGLSHSLAGQVREHLPRGTRLVDLGCGAMPYRPLMSDLGINYLGADLDPTADLVIGADGRVALDAGSCDAVLSVQVLEHVADLDAYCAEIRRLLHDDGTLLLSTHGSWLYHPHPEDHRRWTRTGLIDDLARRGLAVQDLHPIVGPLGTTTLIRLTGFAFALRKLPWVGRMLAGALAIVMNLRAFLEEAITPASMRLDNACVYLVRATKGRGVISRSIFNYALISGCCMLMSNAILIVMDHAGAPLPLSVSLAFAIVVVVGYVLHGLFTFRRTLEVTAFARYVVAMSVNIPLAFLTLWLWRDVAGLSIEAAAPLSTGSTALINFGLCRFAVFGRQRGSSPASPTDAMVGP